MSESPDERKANSTTLSISSDEKPRVVAGGSRETEYINGKMNIHKEDSSVEGNKHFDLSHHYRSVAEKYDYFYQECYEGYIPVLMKWLDLKPSNIVADIASGTGFIAEQLFKLSGLNNPVWCVDPSAEMQEVAQQKKGLYPVQKTAEEFFSDPEINQVFDRVICVCSSHHFVDPVAVYKGILRSLRSRWFFH
ncbi:hypothetical protein OS493_038162 [Desmophyllum pertusum]|uniref:Methyltransferase type 11 domain-containing protein n=1 Tax=Desmophyllum pertusum TaxID=174260 RepID=A0A9X0CJF2_9CNID|nr:hypothetical protein OS493_038162 [Desmophyllum pertusum]